MSKGSLNKDPLKDYSLNNEGEERITDKSINVGSKRASRKDIEELQKKIRLSKNLDENERLNNEMNDNMQGKENMQPDGELITDRNSSKPMASKDISKKMGNTNLEFQFLDNIKKLEDGLENEYDSEQMFLKLSYQEFACAFFSIQSIISTVLFYELFNMDKKAIKDFKTWTFAVDTLLILTSVFSLFFMIMTIMRYILKLRLMKATKDLMNIETLYTTGDWKYLFFELVYILFHPNRLFKDITLKTSESSYLVEVEMHLNDFFIIILLFRVYSFFRFIPFCTKFLCARANRVSKMMGVNLSLSFTIRCLLTSQPFTCILLTWGLLSMKYAYMLKVIEGPVYDVSSTFQDNKINFKSYQNCIWNIFVTMTTVGYGDMYPITTLGRTIVIISSIAGTILISLLIINIQLSMTLNDKEQQVFSFMERIQDKQAIKENGGFYFLSSLRFLRAKTRYKQAIKDGLPDAEIEQLKKQLEDSLYERIKCKNEFKFSFHAFRGVWESYNTYDTIKSKLEFICGQVDTLNENKAYIVDNLKKIQEKKHNEINLRSKNNIIVDLLNENNKGKGRKNDEVSILSHNMSENTGDNNTVAENLLGYNSTQKFKNKNLYN